MTSRAYFLLIHVVCIRPYLRLKLILNASFSKNEYFISFFNSVILRIPPTRLFFWELNKKGARLTRYVTEIVFVRQKVIYWTIEESLQSILGSLIPCKYYTGRRFDIIPLQNVHQQISKNSIFLSSTHDITFFNEKILSSLNKVVIEI